MATRLMDKSLPIGFVLVDHFRIDGVLGQGGFGTTYLAQDTALDCQVAIKEYNPDFATRNSDFTIAPATESDRDSYNWGYHSFLKEAQLLAKFHHPNIVKVRHIFKAHDTAYIVMNYEQGESLLDRFRERGNITDGGELQALFAPVIAGLQTVHERSFLHRDIKPHNLFVRDDGTPLLLDFGSARIQGTDATRTVHPGYTPIEQFEDVHKEGPYTDIYSLGATLYHVITGKPPVSALKRHASIILSDSDPHVPLSTADVSGEHALQLVNAVNSALTHDPEKRPQTLREWQFCAPSSGEIGEEPTILVDNIQLQPVSPQRADKPRWRMAAIATSSVAVLISALVATQFFTKDDNREPIAAQPATVAPLALAQAAIDDSQVTGATFKPLTQEANDPLPATPAAADPIDEPPTSALPGDKSNAPATVSVIETAEPAPVDQSFAQDRVNTADLAADFSALGPIEQPLNRADNAHDEPFAAHLQPPQPEASVGLAQSASPSQSAPDSDRSTHSDRTDRYLMPDSANQGNAEVIASLPAPVEPDPLAPDEFRASAAPSIDAINPPAALDELAIAEWKREFEWFAAALTQDRVRHQGRGRDVQLDTGLQLLQRIARASDSETPWLLSQYRFLIKEMTTAPGYTISNNRAGTGNALDVVNSAAVAGLGDRLSSDFSTAIGDVYAKLVKFSEKHSTRRINLESWANAFAIIDAATPVDGVSGVSENRQRISDTYRRFASVRNSEAKHYLAQWKNFLESIDDIDQPWLNAAWSGYAQHERNAHSCAGSVNSVFAYSKGIGIGDKYATYRFPNRNQTQLGTLVRNLNQFCNIQCVDVWGKSSRNRNDLIKRLKRNGVSAQFRQMSTGFAMNYQYVQVYAVDSHCET